MVSCSAKQYSNKLTKDDFPLCICSFFTTKFYKSSKQVIIVFPLGRLFRINEEGK